MICPVSGIPHGDNPPLEHALVHACLELVGENPVTKADRVYGKLTASIVGGAPKPPAITRVICCWIATASWLMTPVYDKDDDQELT
jgi:hypothetical protein